MGLLGKILGRDKETKADETAEKGSRLPGSLGDPFRGYLTARRTEKEAGKQGGRLRGKINKWRN